jgi:alkylation response protein AidB-like acyl-CoA dehydrogenase
VSALLRDGSPSTGEQIPFGDPGWYQGHYTPHYSASHAAYRKKVRAFVEEHIVPHVHEWDEKGSYPRELHQLAYKAGVYGSGWPEQYGGNGDRFCRHMCLQRSSQVQRTPISSIE